MNGEPTKVLLVEDSPGDARLLREALRDVKDAQIDLADVGRLEEALWRLSEEQFKVILLDLWWSKRRFPTRAALIRAMDSDSSKATLAVAEETAAKFGVPLIEIRSRARKRQSRVRRNSHPERRIRFSLIPDLYGRSAKR